MEETRTFENFPIWRVIFSNSVSLAIVAIGAAILAGLTIWLTISYVVYWLWMEIRVLKRSCVNCAYYGKVCGFGKGKLCSLLFKKGDAKKFAEASISWSDVLPDFLVFVFPIIGGIVSLVRSFSWPVLILLVALAILSFVGNAVVRGSFACKYCRQREIGCPASRLFAGETEGAGS
ncbi:MAG TPA: hypothetical protein VMX15_03185 [Candidatus Heimdallarchaeota archaeon]|nr:hypothetical protein [Candidatus Heimdallarchaeota archaeon]